MQNAKPGCTKNGDHGEQQTLLIQPEQTLNHSFFAKCCIYTDVQTEI